jgi:hypothetical protein
MDLVAAIFEKFLTIICWISAALFFTAAFLNDDSIFFCILIGFAAVSFLAGAYFLKSEL